MATPKTGGEVDAFCTRCKLDLAHTILAMVGSKIARVRCNTCGSERAYRGTQASTPSSPRSTSSKPRATAASREEKVVLGFEQMLADKDVANAAPYSPRTTFVKDQVVSHPTFGLGLVKEVRGDKVDIIFKAETRTLVHGRSGGPADKPSYQPPAAGRAFAADKPQPAEGTPSEASLPDEQA